MKRNIITKAMAGSLCLSVLSGSAIIPGMTVSAVSGTSIISEVCASNTSKAAPDGNYYDWIELYNPGSSALDLSGCGLSDDADKPYDYTFKDGTTIQPGAKLVVYCDSKGTGDIAPFGLSTSGETITLTGKDGSVLDSLTFGNLGENESYAEYPEKSGTFFVTTPTPGSTNAAPQGQNAVKAPEFSVESGFYENAVQLTISSPQNYTIYYTTDGSDPVPGSGTTKQFSGALQLTDRSSEPNVLSAHTDISYPDTTAPGLVDKANVIRAVAVDASGTKSSVITKTYFVGKTAQPAYLRNMKVVSLVTDEKNLFDPTIGIYVRGDVFDAQGYNTGGGTFPGGDWNIPGQQDPNQQQPGQQDPNQQQDPSQQNPGQQNPGNWNMGDWNTGDWNIPGQQAAINADEPAAGEGQQNPGGWNIGGQGGWEMPGGAGGWDIPGGGDFPGMSGFGMLTDKDGKMVQSWEIEANYTQKGKAWEREVSMEVFDSGEPVLAQNVGIRIKGAASRSHAQKSFNVYARSEYGLDSLDFDFFSGTCRKQTNGKKIKKFDSITLRNGGNDNNNTWFRDSINQRLIADRDCAYQATDECMVFIDGEFWGIYQITEKLGDDYLHDHFGIDKASAVMIKNDELEEGTDADLQAWEDIKNFCASNDMSNASNYKRFTDSFDVQSYIDYFAAQIYWNNWDWPQNNTALWKTSTVDSSNPYADGKWRMIIFDTEYGQGLYGQDNTSATYDTFRRIASNTDNTSKMFTALLKNPDFAQQFGITFMDLANYNFTSDKTKPIIDFFNSTYSTQISDTKARFSSSGNGGGWSIGGMGGASGFQAISQFYDNRATNVPRIVSSNLGIENTTGLVTVYNTAAQGTVKFNTLNLDLDQWSGNYFTAYPVTATAEPKEGVTFTGWEVTDSTGTVKTYNDATITVPVTGGVTIKANYSGTAAGSTEKPTTTPTTTPTSAPATTPTTPATSGSQNPGVSYGDANVDGKVNVSDAVAVLQFVANQTKYPLTATGLTNADIDGATGITGSDAIVIQKVDAGVIKQSDLPLKK